MNRRIVVGLIGFAGSGKDSICRLSGFDRAAFADQLKFDLDLLLARGGGAVPKHIARPVYVAYGRAMRQIDPDYWIKRIQIPPMDSNVLLITDVRYINEASWVMRQGGMLVRVHRAGVRADNPEERDSIAAIDELLSSALNPIHNDLDDGGAAAARALAQLVIKFCNPGAAA